jgi:hypothetical protein
MQDPYETLQVLPTAHIEVVKAAYRALDRFIPFDPNIEDKGAAKVALARVFALINTESKRAAYDGAQEEAEGKSFSPGRVDNEALAALVAIIDSLLVMDGSISATSLRDEMFKDGYSNLDYLLAVKTLLSKELIEQVTTNELPVAVPAYKITEQAWTWLEAKRNTFPARKSKHEPAASDKSSSGGQLQQEETKAGDNGDDAGASPV